MYYKKYTKHSNKYGSHEILIDEKDSWILERYGFNLYSDKRRKTIYVMVWDKDDKKQERFALIYVIYRKQYPLIFNYLFNVLALFIIFKYLFWPRKNLTFQSKYSNIEI